MEQYRNAGFSLVGLLISITVGAIFLATFSASFQNMIRATGTVRTDLEFESIRQSLQVLFRNPSLCGKSFLDRDQLPSRFPPSEPFEVKVGGATLAAIGKDLGNRSTITHLVFRVVEGPTAITNGGNRYIAFLEVGTNVNAQRFGRQVLSNKANPFLLAVTTDATGRIETCGTQEDTGGGGGTNPPPSGTVQSWFICGFNGPPYSAAFGCLTAEDLDKDFYCGPDQASCLDPRNHRRLIAGVTTKAKFKSCSVSLVDTGASLLGVAVKAIPQYDPGASDSTRYWTARFERNFSQSNGMAVICTN